MTYATKNDITFAMDCLKLARDKIKNTNYKATVSLNRVILDLDDLAKAAELKTLAK